MSRRDTIIVAALINAGLLIILFVSAIKNGDTGSKSVVSSQEKNSIPFNDTVSKITPKVSVGDEVDQVLNQYTKQNPLESRHVAFIPESASKVESQANVLDTAQKAPNNFVDDLNALTKASENLSAIGPVDSTSSTSAAAMSQFREILVKKGDVLEKIARVHNTTVQELMKLNKLSSTSLHIGQTLRVPNIAAPSTQTPAAVVSTAQSDNGDFSIKYYVVKSGDNPWTIAVKNHIKVDDLLRLNNMDEAKARKLKPGDQIRIR